MKRWIGSLALSLVAGAVMAQAPFTIVRPADNSRVREKVKVLIPKGSIPSSGYIGVFLDDKFLEAVKPPLKGKYYEYVLDTKGRGIPDTPSGRPAKLELVLYVDYGEQPRIVDRSSVDINIGNQASIPIPNSGLSLRYRFTPGAELVYTMQQRTTVYSISEDQNKLGGRAAQLPVEGETIRMLYAVDSVYPGGDALLRMQALPSKGKDYADLTTAGSTEPRRFYNYEMAPIYMRVTPTGHQTWGSIPVYVPMEGSAGESSRLDLFAAFPLPTLPTKNVRPGDSWKSRFQNGMIDLEKLNEVTSVVRTFPARGEFVGVEWERGHPCAKVKNTIAAAEKSMESKKLASAGAGFQNDAKLKVDETIWFALDTRKVIKVVHDETLEMKGDTATFGFGSGGGGSVPGRGGAPMGRGGGRPGGMGGRGGGDVDVTNPTAPTPLRQGPPPGYGPGGPGGYPGGPGGYPGGPGGYPGGPGGGGYGAGRSTPQQAFLRIRTQRIFTLEE